MTNNQSGNTGRLAGPRRRRTALAGVVLLGLFILAPAGARGQPPGRGTPAGPGQTQPDFAAAANPFTFDSLAQTMLYPLGREQPSLATFRQLGDDQIIRLLAAGKLDIGSIFLRPGSTQIDGLNKALPRPATVYVLGQVVTCAVVPPGRNLPQLTVEQLGQILSGRITRWQQVGGGEGDIVIGFDDASLAVVAAVTGANVYARFPPSRPIDERVRMNNMMWDLSKRHEARLSNAALPASPVDNYLLLRSEVSGLPFDQNLAKYMQFVPIAAAASQPAVLPNRKTVASGAYPLRANWRIIVRPDAGRLAQGTARACAMGVTTAPANCVPPWLILPDRAELPDAISMFYYGGRAAFLAAAERFIKDHPAVRIVDVPNAGITEEAIQYQAEAQFAQRADLLIVIGDLFPNQRAKLVKACEGELAETVVAHWPVLVLANPKCPVNSLTLEQLRAAVAQDGTKWRDLGWDNGQAVVAHARGVKLLGDALFGGKERWASDDRDLAKVATLNYRDEDGLLRAVATDPNAIGLLAASESALASGLKVLKIAATRGTEAEPSAARVIAGDYPVVLPVKVLVHPKAGPAAREFAAWLSSAPAAELLARYDIYCKSLPQAAVAGPTPIAGPASQPEPPGPAFTGAATGAVAVLPTATLSLYFMMADETHHAAYEDAIYKAIQADARLKLVDRTQLNKVWVERQYALLAGQTKFPPMVSADVFVVPAIVPDGRRSVLRVQFLHASSASLLAEVRLPINPQSPATFDPPLEQTVASAWQAALGRLAQARGRRSWSVVTVYAGSADQLPAATQCEQQLRQTLRQDKRVFLAESVDLDDAQQEVLMAMLGVSRPIEGGFSTAADFLVDGRLEAGRLELRILEGQKLGLVAENSFAADAGQQIGQWLNAQVQRLSQSQVAPAAPPAPSSSWSKKQALLELENAKRTGQQIDKLKADAELRRAKAGLAKMTDDDAAALQTLADRQRQQLARGAQLDPESEPIAWAALCAVQDDFQFLTFVRLARMYERFVERFPRSANARRAGEWAIVKNTQAAALLRKNLATPVWGVPRGIDHAALRLVYIGRAVQVGDAFAARYAARPNEYNDSSGCGYRFPDFITGIYMPTVAAYAVLRKADPAEVDATVKRWSDIFDARPAAGPHSDFLRMHVVALRNDKPKFLGLLTDMQRRHADPKDAYWVNGASVARRDLSRLFGFACDQKTFGKWLDGKGEIGGLPYEGYDPAKDTTKLWPAWELE